MRRKKSDLQLTHRHFGLGDVLYKIATDAGNGLLVKFADKRRIILVDSQGWTNPDDADAAFAAAKEEPRPKEAPKKAIRIRGADDLQTAEVGQEAGE